MINPLEKYQEFKGWIPPEDVDGIDCPREYLRDAINVDFNNGFLGNAPAPVEIPLPTVIQTLVNDGWELLRRKYFRHTTQGDTYFSLLFKENELKYFVNETELILNREYTFTEKPTDIYFSLVNNQLKINLNITGTYDTDKTVIFNLTLVYIKSFIYGTAYIRPTGWVLSLRWLGTSYDITLGTEDISYIRDPDGKVIKNAYKEDFDNATYPVIPNITLYTFTRSDGYVIASNDNDADPLSASVNIGLLRRVKTLKFNLGFRIGADPHTVKVYINDTDTEGRILHTTQVADIKLEAGGTYPSEFEIDINKWTEHNVFTISFQVVVSKKVDSSAMEAFVSIPYIILEGFDVILISKNDDQQRSLCAFTNHTGCFAALESFKVPKVQVDPRTTNYEIYAGSSNTNIYYLLIDFPIIKDDGSDNNEDFILNWVDWTEDSTDYIRVWTFGVKKQYPAWWDEKDPLSASDVTTLNFNYGLGSKVKVNKQRKIFKEAFYRNKVYFVNGDEKLYYSHLSGTGQAQPDSFPFDEDVKFGYYVTSFDSRNKDLAVTQLEELIVITDKGDWIYTIEGTAGQPLKRIKAINGGFPCLNSQSLPTDLSGSPQTKALLWFDRWAVYAYGGGRSLPVPITGNSLKNYWQKLNGKFDAIAFYNRSRNEYWIQVDSKVLIYELDTNTWKKYEFEYTIKDVIGIVDDYTYFLTEDNRVFKIDPLSTEYLQATIEFHDDVAFEQSERGYTKPGSEIQDKVLQEVVVHWKDVANNHAVLTIIPDDNIVSPDIVLGANYTRFPSMTPLLVIFGKIRFKLVIEPTSAKLKEFGFAYSMLDTYSPGSTALMTQEVRGIGQESGGESGVVF